MLRLTISQPCHERWEEMTPVEKGAFCNSCKKEVTDFSRMSDGEITNHLANHQFQPACGRFRDDQLNRPLFYISSDVLLMDIPTWKKFLAVVFICFSGFLTGCSTNNSNPYAAITEATAPPPFYFETAKIEPAVAISDPPAPVEKKINRKKIKKNPCQSCIGQACSPLIFKRKNLFLIIG